VQHHPRRSVVDPDARPIAEIVGALLAGEIPTEQGAAMSSANIGNGGAVPVVEWIGRRIMVTP